MMGRMLRTIPVLIMAAAVLARAEKVPAAKLLEMARSNAPELEQTLRDTLTEDAIKKGAAVIGEGPDFVWAVISERPPMLRIDLGEPVAARKLGGLWFYMGKLRTGTAHKTQWLVDG